MCVSRDTTQDHPHGAKDLEQEMPKITLEDVKRTVGPLTLIFWGALICIVDIWISSGGFKFDFLSDVVGMIMIAVGLFKLGDIEVHPRYASALSFAKIMAVVGIVLAILDHFVFRCPGPLSLLLLLLGMLQLVAIIVFCVAMRWFCDEAGLHRSSGSWRTTTILFVVIYLVPLGLFYIVGGVAILAGKSFNIDLGPAAALLLIPIFCIPIIHLLVSSRRMIRDAEDFRPPQPGSGPANGAEPL